MLQKSCFFALVLVFACGPSPRRISSPMPNGNFNGNNNGNANIRPGPNVNSQQTSATSASTKEKLGKLNAHLSNQGFKLAGPARRSTVGLVAYPLSASPNRCHVVAAFGQQGTDVNIAVIDPTGLTVGTDNRPDEHPWVHFCPSKPGSYLVRVQPISGAKPETIFVVFDGPTRADPRMAEFFGAARVAAAQTNADIEKRIAKLDKSLSSKGYKRAGDARGVQIARTAEKRWKIQLNNTTCYRIASLGGEPGADTDIFVSTAQGDRVMVSAGDSRDEDLEYCPANTGTYTLEVKNFGADSSVFIAFWSKASKRRVLQQTSTSEQDLFTGGAEQGASLEEVFGQRNADMLSRGYQSIPDSARRGTLNASKLTHDLTLNLSGGKCYAFSAVGGSSLRKLDVEFYNAGGTLVDRDVEDNARPVVRVCPEESGSYKIRLVASSGAGEYIYQAYAWPRGTSGPFGMKGLVFVRLSEVTSLLGTLNYEADINFSPGSGTLRAKQEKSHTLEFESAGCYAIATSGDSGFQDIDVSIETGGKEVTHDESSTAFPDIRFCAEAGKYKLKIKAASGSGKYFYQVFKRTE